MARRVDTDCLQINVNEVELTIFKGTNSILASDIAKVVIRYAR